MKRTKSEIAKGKSRDSKGKFVKKEKEEKENIICISTHPRIEGELSKNAIEFFLTQIRRARERKRL